MQVDLSGRTAVVSGSTKGIGLATVIGLADAGARVVVNGRRQAGVDAALAAVREAVARAAATGYAIDLTTAEGCSTLVQAGPRADIIDNNLGLHGPRDFLETTDETWRDLIEADRRTSNAAYAELPIGHLSVMEAPDVVAAPMRQFLRAHSA